jgi:hypothetical protein
MDRIQNPLDKNTVISIDPGHPTEPHADLDTVKRFTLALGGFGEIMVARTFEEYQILTSEGREVVPGFPLTASQIDQLLA